jgi:hypothetical protein
MDTTPPHTTSPPPTPQFLSLHPQHPHSYADDRMELEKFISFYAFSLAYLLLQAGCRAAGELISIFALFNKEKVQSVTGWKKIGSDI